jgi:hypothetical protein
MHSQRRGVWKEEEKRRKRKERRASKAEGGRESRNRGDVVLS